ncbi:hypothetical protein VOLCADRAFT_88088 [Volvox carteri f. nagariensis]|uniref:C2 domain-containing protein n=1 Tax=Volvox carteri f. nagariensis TaxID=3068 RepID=D8TN16_VOLCA|nr:uncharacterized protein VOLCADRAFT_88088 [Volvox carteri f. nagariensis]EFJ51225.1 hypothetical protein VOLCADRAFT_88088 [Volvox carteri f. nagariensis]|eukprot:XP_002947692.1 hypothetical protein VOLCADRAFT_88088 [Volvox carteri f. nagariensis]
MGTQGRLGCASGLRLTHRTRQRHQHHSHHDVAQQQQQQQQLAQRVVPTTPMASATKLPARGGVGAGGVALGIILTVALQLVGRWLQRQRWAQQLMELLDLRRSSGSSASTSGMYDDGADGFAAAGRRPGGRRGGSTTSQAAAGGDAGAVGSSVSGSVDGAAGRFAFLGSGGGDTGSLQGSPLGTLDGGGVGLGVGQGVASLGSSGAAAAAAAALPSVASSDPGESVEWVNMCWRKVWRVYQRGLERWIIDLLQPVFDGLVKDGSVPRWLCRLRVVELTLDHEAPYFSNMRRRNSRKDSDLNGVVDLRYTGGARMLLMLELGEGRWRFKVPVLVSDLDLECQMWLKLRLAPMCPWIGTISLAFVGPPNVKVQLSPYNRVRLMRVPVVQNYLRKLLTVDLPALMVLPQRLEINIPPSVTTIAEAAVGRDTIMRAVASAVLQADAVEAALLAALPLGPQTPAGGVTLPEAFKGELGVTLREARNLPVWGFPGQSNPYVRLVLGEQAVQSRREGDTSHPGRHRAPVWNQEFQFLVENPEVQVLELLVKDSHLTGRTEVGRATIKLADVLVAQHSAEGGKLTMWVPLQPPAGSYGITGGEPVPTGDVLLELSYKAFDDDEQDSGYREAENYSKQAAAQAPITDIRSAAAASSRAAVAASAAVSAIAMTRAAAARAAARAARAAQEAAAAAAGAAKGAVDQGASIIAQQQQQVLPPLPPLAVSPPKQLPANATYMAAPPPPWEAQPAAVPGPSTALAAAGTSDNEVERAVAVSGQLPATAPPSPAAPVGSVGGTGTACAGRDGDAGEGGDSTDLAQHVLAAAAPPAAAAAGAVMATAPGAVAVPGMRVRVAVEEKTNDDGSVAKLAALPEGTETKVMVTATATAPAVQQTRRTATAVLERPQALGPGDGGSSNGRMYGGDIGGTAVAADSRWRRREPDGGSGADVDAASSSRTHHGDGGGDAGGEDNASNGNGNGAGSDGASAGLPAVVAVEVLEAGPHQLGGGGAAAAPGRTLLLPPRPLKHSVDKPAVHVTAEVVVTQAASGPPSHGVEVGRDQGQAAAGGTGDGGAVGVTGPVLSALVSLTASAHSLTAAAIEKARESLSQKTPPPPLSSAGDGGSGGGGGDEHPWWQFWVPKGGTVKLQDAGAADGDGTGAAASAAEALPASKGGAAAAPAEPSDGSGAKPWWQFWSDGDKERDKGEDGDGSEGLRQGAEGEDHRGSKPVEAIYIPADLPLEEIAAEVQRLKEDSWRERSDHVSSLWRKAVERNDRKWLMLAAFLLSVAVGLLTVVAWRLEQLEHMQAAVPQIALMTMQAALQALEQHASSGGGGLL